MTKHTHYVLTCTKNHTWHEPIPATKPAIGEHRLCPKCGGSSWIAPDAPKITKANKLTLSQNFVTNVTSSGGEDVDVIGKLDRVSPDAISKTKKIPIPADLIPTRELLNEESKTTIPGEDLRETLRNALKANN